MHELAIMQNVVSVCEREAEKHGFKRVKTIALAVGAVSGIVPECMFEFFPAAASGTVAEGAKLTTRARTAATRGKFRALSAPAAAEPDTGSRTAGSFTSIRSK